MNNREQVTLNRVFAALMVVSVGVWVFVLVVEKVGGMEACVLCKLQRIPYALIGLNSVLGIFTSIKKGFFKGVIGTVVRQVGDNYIVQLGGVKDPCVRRVAKLESSRDYTALLTSGASCSRVSWELLGMPLSLYNTFLSFTLFLVARYYWKPFLLSSPLNGTG